MISRILTTLTLVGLLCVAAFAAPHNTLLDVRVGPHKSFDRVVFEFQDRAAAEVIVKDARTLEVRFNDVRVPDPLSLPMLPRGLAVIRNINAYKEGESVAIFEIILSGDAVPTELPLEGSPWRLAVDIEPRTAQKSPPVEEKPEYIPGDLPIPTKLADVKPTASEPQPQTEHNLADVNGTSTGPVAPAPETSSADSTDPARLRSVLAFYYLSKGDTHQAKEQAALYEKLSGHKLDLLDQTTLQASTAPVKNHRSKWWPPRVPNVPIALQLVLVFGAGFGGGVFVWRRFGSQGSVRTPKPPKPPKVPREKKQKKAKEPHKELEEGLDALEDAVRQEPARASASAPPEPDPVPEPVLEVEGEVRESLMDRRVRRVLELSKEGRSITDIAEELQMGQDEVKLILDLNQ
jgi:hypothetical protein